MDHSELDAFLQAYWSDTISFPEFFDHVQVMTDDDFLYVSERIIDRSKRGSKEFDSEPQLQQPLAHAG